MSRRMDIEIETPERGLEVELFETSSFSSGKTHITLSDGSTVTYAGALMRKAAGLPEVLHVVVEFAGEVGTALFSAWLYDRLKNKKAKLRINRTEVEITPDRIRIVIEEIEKED